MRRASVDQELPSLDAHNCLPCRTRLLRDEREAHHDDEAEISHVGRPVGKPLQRGAIERAPPPVTRDTRYLITFTTK